MLNLEGGRNVSLTSLNSNGKKYTLAWEIEKAEQLLL
jgi:hypothetical protein